MGLKPAKGMRGGFRVWSMVANVLVHALGADGMRLKESGSSMK